MKSLTYIVSAGIISMLLLNISNIKRLNNLESQISISRDHEKRLAVEVEMNKYEMSVLSDAIKKLTETIKKEK